MKWHGSIHYTIFPCIVLLWIAPWFSSVISDHLLREWVVRFDDKLALSNIQWPEHIKLISLHEPTHCAVIQTRLSKRELQELIAPMDESAYLSTARKDEQGSPVYPTGSVVLALDSNIDPRQISRDLNCDVERYLDQLHWLVVRIPNTHDFNSFRDRCLSTRGVQSVFPDEIILCQSHQTNDPLYASSWHIAQANDKDIDADEGWNLIPANAPNKSITLIEGVGFDTLNADLSGRFIDRYNATNQSTNVYSNATVDKHGTAVAGIPGAIYNNAISAAGLGMNKLRLQVIRIGYNTTASGTFSTSSSFQADAINRAMSLSTTAAISMSFGSSTYQSAFYSAIQSALTQGRANKGIPVFASSGNGGLSSWTNYPASYGNVIAVGATTSQDLRSTSSNYGPSLTLSAPGSSIATTDITGANGYSTGDNTFFSGTSAAAPVAAAIGALMIVTNPEITSAQVKQYLAQSCEKVGGYSYTANAGQNLSTWSTQLGYGRVNMRAALQLCLPQTPSTPDVFATNAGSSSLTPTVGTSITIQATQTISTSSGATSAATLEYRYSLDATWSADDIVIGTDISQLGGGIASENESITYTIPSGSGTRYILIMADATSQITESNENNNLISLPITVSAGTALPDIFLTGATVSSSTVAVGQSITINAIQNRNPQATATSYSSLQYRLSPDAIWENTDTYIGSDVSTFTTTIGSEVENITYTIPNTPGNRFVLLRCDASNTTAEANENNNVVAIPITIIPAATEEMNEEHSENTHAAKWNIYPNPAHDRIFIHEQPDGIEVGHILSADGKICRELSKENIAVGIDINTLEPGTYVLLLISGDHLHSRQFIKE